MSLITGMFYGLGVIVKVAADLITEPRKRKQAKAQYRRDMGL